MLICEEIPLFTDLIHVTWIIRCPRLIEYLPRRLLNGFANYIIIVIRLHMQKPIFIILKVGFKLSTTSSSFMNSIFHHLSQKWNLESFPNTESTS